MINSTFLFLIVNSTHVLIRNSSLIEGTIDNSHALLNIISHNIKEDTRRQNIKIKNATLAVESSHHQKRSDCQCGHYNKETQMIDENKVWLANFPWLVGFVSRDENDDLDNIPVPFCYGSLINSRYIIGAANCLLRAKATSTDAVFFGGRLIGERRRRRVAEILIHAGYNNTDYLNNLALVKLKDSVFKDNDADISPVCLPDLIKYRRKSQLQMQRTTIPIRQEYRTVFYGQLSYYFGVLEPRIIRTGKGDCKDLFIERLQSNNLCDHESAISYSNYCYAESGMPVMQFLREGKKSDGKHVLLGVFSAGYGCRGYTGERPAADVATEIIGYVPWILENSSGGNECIGLA